MTDLQTILKAWERYSNENDPKSPSVLKWCESLILISEMCKTDTSYTADIIVAATDYFDNKLSEQDKRDAFFYILGLYNRK